jgi:hypothetical protein
MQRERDAESADATARNDHGQPIQFVYLHDHVSSM